MKQALLTGVTGYVGAKLYQLLKERGIDVVAIIRSSSSSLKEIEKGKLKGLKYVIHDFDKEVNLREKLEKINFFPSEDLVFYHFGWTGEKSLTDGDMASQMKNVHITTEAIKQAKSVGCNTFINSGTFEETLMECSLNQALQESIIDIKSIPRNYAIAKLANRNMCFLTAYLEKIDYIHTRFSVPVSNMFDSGRFIENQILQIKSGENVPTPRNINPLNFIHIDDLVEAYYEIGMKGGNQKDYFIRTELFIKLSDLFSYLSKLNNNAELASHFPVNHLKFYKTDSKKQEDWVIDNKSIRSHFQKFIIN